MNPKKAWKSLKPVLDKKTIFLFQNHFLPIHKEEYNYPFIKIKALKEELLTSSVVACGTGADSIATLYLSKISGINPVAISVDYNRKFISSKSLKKLRLICKKLQISHHLISLKKYEFDKLLFFMKKTSIPCNFCKKLFTKRSMNMLYPVK